MNLLIYLRIKAACCQADHLQAHSLALQTGSNSALQQATGRHDTIEGV